jgi:hypothetical protein
MFLLILVVVTLVMLVLCGVVWYGSEAGAVGRDCDDVDCARYVGYIYILMMVVLVIILCFCLCWCC